MERARGCGFAQANARSPRFLLIAVASLSFAAGATARAQVAVDVTVPVDRGSTSTTITTAPFTTRSAHELLLAFVSSDGSATRVSVTGVSGAGLTWALVARTNLQLGTAEIWRAFAPSPLTNVAVTATLSQSVAASMTVMSFTGVDTSGTGGSGAIGHTGTGNSSSGAPTATLTTTRNGSLVIGVGNDWDNAIARTPGANQGLVHQYLAPVGDTYWVQRQNSATALLGSSVTINDTAPTTDRYNLTICEILPAPAVPTYLLSGTVSPTTAAATTTLALSGAASATTAADSAGNFSFTVPNGTYTVTPSSPGYTFAPSNATVTINGAPVAGVSFTATALTYGISGAISPVASGVGTLLTLGGAASGTTSANASAAFSFTGLAPGSYTVTPSKAGFTFTPGSATVSLTTTSVTGVNFTAAAAPSSSISGTITPSSAGAGAVVLLSGSPSAYAVADASGRFSFTSLPAGTYTLTATRTGFSFSPSSLKVALNGTPSTGNAFTATPLSLSSLNYPDLKDILPPAAISIVGSGGSRVFQYTHDTFEAGTGPLEIQPVYNPASGNYQGIQHVYSLSNGVWTVAQTIPVAGAFVFDSAHGHFHFPFVAYGLYASNANGTIGEEIAPSTKDGFCIDNSFVYDSLLPNAGFGTWGSCTDPLSLRGLSIGEVDEYDQTDEGQAITIGTLADGVYWLRAIVDPNNFLAESDKTNNETDVQMRFTGNTVTVLQVVTPVLPPPPSVALSAPLDNSQVSGTVQITASTPSAGGTGMQFLLDGQAFGAVDPSAPYAVSWDTTTTANGTHWLAAQYVDVTGRIGTSPVVTVNVANSGTSAPLVTVTDPSAGSTVNAVVTLAATVGAEHPVASLQFYVDGVAVGAPVTSAPYATFWDTEAVADGTHSVTATATDTSGGVGTSVPVSVTVDNSHPANPIQIDAQVVQDGLGTMTSPPFTTTTNSDLLVAFVALDGPAATPQTATVSGAGLTWTLLKRSNSQAGTAETWAARATDFLTNATVVVQPGVGTGYHGSLVVLAFANAAGPGVVGQASAPSGAPDVYLPGVSAGNWVFAVGNDWDNAVARTPVAGQYLVHQRVDTGSGDTYWVQATNGPSTANALVDIHDSAPTSDRWNYCAVEIVATRQ